MEKNTFEMLYSINVNEKTEKKNDLTYLSWAWAWAEFKKVFPNAEYQIWKNEQGRPYIYDENLGYMVYTSVTVDGLTHEMWLPVMDGANRAMKAQAYEVKTKYKTYEVAPATMMDINKAVMRCLTKNLAMFGLGLYIYAGEDLPEDDEKPVEKKKAPVKTPPMTKLIKIPTEGVTDYRMALVEWISNSTSVTFEDIASLYKLSKDSSQDDFRRAVEQINDEIDKTSA